MSRVYFHSRSNDAELRGAERAHAACLVKDLMMTFLPRPLLDERDWRRDLLPARLSSPSYPVSEEQIACCLTQSENLILHGRAIDTFCLMLNTAIAGGSDPVRLLARLHGQCEIHCYVREGNRPWLADVIREGRGTGLLRPDMGWESVIELLETPNDGPVVCSYSVCRQFPNPYVLPSDHPVRQHKEPCDALYDLEDSFMTCFDAISQEHGLELRPEDWSTMHFGDAPCAWELKTLWETGRP